ncbi:hypothetical protein IE53DRAFT_359665 [Violaceomyces palustris]|uniref:Uncharacterized protein n=1 Tax=Violaceomyces palustris TaxID=1673888 RepID=A0ACD0P716_9BASI|nr:hypothetical protein IE53DRAFT_359665 [Violaceomyces palustris]
MVFGKKNKQSKENANRLQPPSRNPSKKQQFPGSVEHGGFEDRSSYSSSSHSSNDLSRGSTTSFPSPYPQELSLESLSTSSYSGHSRIGDPGYTTAVPLNPNSPIAEYIRAQMGRKSTALGDEIVQEMKAEYEEEQEFVQDESLATVSEAILQKYRDGTSATGSLSETGQHRSRSRTLSSSHSQGAPSQESQSMRDAARIQNQRQLLNSIEAYGQLVRKLSRHHQDLIAALEREDPPQAHPLAIPTEEGRASTETIASLRRALGNVNESMVMLENYRTTFIKPQNQAGLRSTSSQGLDSEVEGEYEEGLFSDLSSPSTSTVSVSTPATSSSACLSSKFPSPPTPSSFSSMSRFDNSSMTPRAPNKVSAITFVTRQPRFADNDKVRESAKNVSQYEKPGQVKFAGHINSSGQMRA